jgi:SRSO17 transposase
VLVIDDTALPKKGRHSVGVAPQYATVLGKQANCQTLVSLTLARHEVPVPIALRLYLPEVWTEVARRLARAGCRSYGGGSARSPSLSSRSERLCGGTPNADAIAPHAV